ncbi:hypothetical protein UJ101_00727 [Flavobacteriaceae bacterium UJ101]|nr:hypothetical protein UJ101_00727 [Flavobacteriaceae bacterium UJ101]
MTRIRLLFILTIFISSLAFGQSDKKKELKTELIGAWEFVELRDAQENKIDTIWHNVPVPGVNKKSYEIPKGPLLTYKSDGTYSKQFTPKNTDTGKWYYDKNKKAIIQMLYYSKPYGTAAQYLIDKGHASKDENGEYYEVITDEVIELTEDKLIILEREGRQRTFKKKK